MSPEQGRPLFEYWIQSGQAWETWALSEKDLHDEPALWFHDIFRRNGTPYDLEEAKTIWWHTTGADLRFGQKRVSRDSL